MNSHKTYLTISAIAKHLPGELGEPFWRSVEQTDGCWEWQRARFDTGYGAVWRDGRVQKAHRVAFELTNGPIPQGALVIHSCDNRACCRPDHLRLGTHRENTADMDARGRRTGDGRTKLTKAQVAEIRQRWAAGETQIALGRAFGVSNVHVHHIVRGARRVNA